MKDLAEITFKVTISGNEKVGERLLKAGERVLDIFIRQEEQELDKKEKQS